MRGSGSKDLLAEAAEWFFRQDGRALSAEEEARFRSWLAASDAHRAAYAEISGTWHEMGKIAEPVSDRRSLWRGVRMSIAAAFTAVAILTGGAWYLDIPTRWIADGYTATAELKTIDLPDGSTAELNGDTAIALSYTAHERRIRLVRGEAVFTVSHDPQRPFIVEAHGGEAKAIGTVYGVRENSAGVTVTVIESRVEITAGGAGSPPVYVGADQRVHYRNGRLDTVEPVEAASETAWRRRKMIFVDKPLGDVVAELNRYHNGIIRIVDGSIRSRRVSGVFETGDIAGVVDALEKSFGFSDTRIGTYVILIHR